MDVAPLYSRLHGTIGLVVVGAIRKLAGIHVRFEIGKVVRKILRMHVVHPELPDAGRVNDIPFIRERVQFGMGRGVGSLLGLGTHAARSEVEVRLEGID